MKKYIAHSLIVIFLNVSSIVSAQESYTYSLVDNGGFNYTITAIPNANTTHFATSVQSYGFTILLPDGVTASLVSSLGNSANATFFDGNAVGETAVDGYLITETLGSPVSLSAPSSGKPIAMVTIQLNQSPTSGNIRILENDDALATTITSLKSFMAADMIDDNIAVFPNVVNPNIAGNSGISSYMFTTLSTPEESTIDFSIYPNPTTDTLYINQTQNIEKIEIININGQFVLTQQKELVSVYVGHLQSGEYFLKVYSSGGSMTKKFIKN
ncbi:MAG: T9SS type A sorting domain-containing protein [Bacteroidota bacterium]